MPISIVADLLPKLRALAAPALIATLAVIAGCAEIRPEGEAGTKLELVYPGPPDEPRFIFERSIASSADVIADSDDDQFRRLLTGELRSGTAFAKPYAAAVHHGRLFVSDTADRTVKAFDLHEQKFFLVGQEEPGLLIKPIGLDTDDAGNIYVADATARAIQIYDRDGRHLRKIGGKDLFDRLTSVTASPDGSRIYVVDIGGVLSDNHRIRVFDAHTGEHIRDIGKRGAGPGEFNLPRDLAIGKDGRLYVVDGGNFRVQIFDAEGKYLDAFGKAGRQYGNFSRPKEIAIGPDGNVYVADAAFGNFQIFNPDGDLLMFVGQRSESPGPGRYMLPSGITVDDDGRIYFVDQWFRKVDVFRPVALTADGGFGAPAKKTGK
ncbi:MAG: 6-bladed beta-propeller [Rhodocyclaceae bacterium]|nr:6-bladed beta-propeller [Rhodocyclaceae bacterium]MCP5236108.1 6-bladed beta-propeller [Zoogloeaceae bacterium]